MKKNFYTPLQIVIILLGFITLNAQNYLDIDPTTSTNRTLSQVIAEDTTATGEHVENRIYRLERGGNYLMNFTLLADYDVNIIAHGDETKRKPMIVRGKNAEGSNIGELFILTKVNTNSSFKDIFFNGVDLEKEYGIEWTKAMRITADDARVSVQGCVFNAFMGGATTVTGSNVSLFIRDCIYRNGVAAHHMFFGQQIVLPALPVDTLVVINTTYFNNGSYFIYQGGGLIGHQVIDHNTIFTSLVDAIQLRYSSNASIRSNLYYGSHAYGDSDEFRTLTVYETDDSPYCHFSVYEAPTDLLDAAGISEDDRRIELTHNAYFTPQPIQNYWEGLDEIDNECVWLNERTKALFVSHLGFVENNNYNLDPNFTDTAMDTYITNAVADYGINYRATLSPGEPLSGNAGTKRNYDEHLGDDILLGIQWPLPENLAYSNETLLTGGHDGLAVGDLNWFPEMRKEYIDPITGLKDPNSTKTVKTIGLKLSPNPTSDLLNIVTKSNIQKIEVYDLGGKLIINKSSLRTNHTSINMENEINGVYLVKIQTKEGVGVSKFIKK